MNYLEAIALGIVQGLTEFLPVSSSGHLVVAQNWLGLRPEEPQMLVFDLVAHMGTLLAACLVFHDAIRGLLHSKHLWRTLSVALVACSVTAGIAIAGQHYFKRLFMEPLCVAAAFAVTGVLLWWIDHRPRQRGSWRHFGARQAIIVGLAQAAAVAPGISRSGATIAVAAGLGLRRRWAAEFSFLIAGPVILGATALEVYNLAADYDGLLQDSAGLLLVGGATSCVVGYYALKLLLSMVRRARLHWFSYYLWAMAALVVVLTLT